MNVHHFLTRTLVSILLLGPILSWAAPTQIPGRLEAEHYDSYVDSDFDTTTGNSGDPQTMQVDYVRVYQRP